MNPSPTISPSDIVHVEGLQVESLDVALRLWKSRYRDDVARFEREMFTHPAQQDFKDFVREMWEHIEPFSAADALQVRNLETRRLYFRMIGVERMFKEMSPTLLDRQVVQKKRARWDSDNREREYLFEDVYELYMIESSRLTAHLESTPSRLTDRSPAYAVRCWCTTTGREYWIYVNREAAMGEWWRIEEGDIKKDPERYKPDAIRAIAWTIRLDISEPERIYRQGDIIVVRHSPASQKVRSYHLGKEDYLRLMYSET